MQFPLSGPVQELFGPDDDLGDVAVGDVVDGAALVGGRDVDD